MASLKPNHDLVGASATELVKVLPRLIPDVSHFVAVRYVPNPGVDSRVTRLQKDWFNVPGALAKLFDEVPGIKSLTYALNDPSQSGMKEMLRHDNSSELDHEILLDSLSLNQDLDVALASLANSEALGIASDVRLIGGQVAHLPLLDFSISPSLGHRESVRSAACLLGIDAGVVLESGRSYHVYGFKLLSQSEWVKLFARSLLLAPMVDVRFVAHRLLAGRSVLRINKTPDKPHEPRVVSLL